MSGVASSDPEERRLRALRGLSKHETERSLSEPGTAELRGLPRFARYELRGKLGEGAAAVVYRAWDRELERPVALKLLRESLRIDETARDRFRREAKIMGGLSHPHIVAVYDVGDVDGQLYFVMELVEGRTLADALRDPAFARPDRLRLLEKIARAVGVAHARGIVHRDLKPGNVLVSAAGEPKVADFGLARTGEADLHLTRTGAVLGTPLYMAPEQVRGDGAAITPRTDLYALGAMLYEILAERPPHLGTSLPEVYGRILREDPAPLKPDVPAPLAVVALKALERDPARRYADAEAFADDLGRAIEGRPIAARPVTAAARAWRRAVERRAVLIPAAGSVILALALAGGWIRTRSAEERQAKALELLERARGPLEKGVDALYRSTSDDAEIVRRATEADLLIDQAAALSPELPLAHYRKGEALELRGDYERAQEAWTRSTRVGGRFGPGHYRLGRILLWRAYLASLYLWPDEREPKRLEAERLARDGAREIEAARAEGSGFDNELHRQVAAAMLAHLRGDAKETLRLCEEGVRRFGTGEGVEEFHWLAGLRAREVEAQIAAFDEALRKRPHFPLALYARGHAKSVRADNAGAIRDYDAVLRALPDFLDARLSRGDARFASGDGPGALADYDDLIRRGALLPAAYNGRGRTKHELLRDPDGALADLGEAIRLKPDANVLPYLARARVRLEKGDADGALADAEKALTFDQWADHYLLRGRAKLAKGDRAGARTDLERARRMCSPGEAMRVDVDAWLERAR